MDQSRPVVSRAEGQRGMTRKGHKEPLCGDGKVLYLDFHGAYTTLYTFVKIHWNCTYEKGEFHCVEITY